MKRPARDHHHRGAAAGAAPWRRPWWGRASTAALAAAALAVLLYGPTISYELVYDDLVIVGDDPRLDDPGFGLEVWAAPWWAGEHRTVASRPLTTFTFWLQNQAHGRDGSAVAGLRAVNVGLYALLCAQVALLAWRWLGGMGNSELVTRNEERGTRNGERERRTRTRDAGRRTRDDFRGWAAWAVGLLFAAHPLHVEPVASVVGRAELLAAVFGVGALQLWLRWRSAGGGLTWRRAVWIGLLILAAGLSKEHGYLTAVVIAAAELAARRVEGRTGRNLVRPAPERRMAAVIGVVAALAVAQRAAVWATAEAPKQGIAEIDNPLVTATTAERLVTPLKLIGKAAQLLAAPVNGSPDYSPRILMPTDRLDDPLVLMGLAAVGLWVAAVGWAWRRRQTALGPLLAMPVAWAIPSNTLLLIGTIFAERLLTMLSVFTLVAAAALAPESWLRGRRAWVAAVVVAAAVCGCGLVTVRYSAAWRDDPTLVAYTVDCHPRSARFQAYLARDLMRAGLYVEDEAQRRRYLLEAEQRARRSLELWPRQTMAYEVLGLLAEQRGDAAAARRYYRMARYSGPGVNVGDAGLSRLGERGDEAAMRRRQHELEQRLAQRPDDAEAIRKLAELSVQLKQTRRAVDLYERIVSPAATDTRLIAGYVEALIAEGRYAEAAGMYGRWIELEPDRWSLLTDGALMAIASGRWMQRARRWIDRAIELNPAAAEPWAALGNWHEARGEREEAARALRAALERAGPDDPKRAHYQLMLDRVQR